MADIDGTANASSTNLSTSVGPTGWERRERAMAEAALTLAEIGEQSVVWGRGLLILRVRDAESLLTVSDEAPADDDPEALLPIRSIKAVEANVPVVELSRQRVVEEMEGTVQRGLNELVRPPFCFLGLPNVKLIAMFRSRRTTPSSRRVSKPHITSPSSPHSSTAS